MDVQVQRREGCPRAARHPTTLFNEKKPLIKDLLEGLIKIDWKTMDL
jgi:hypothetical protein